MQGRRPRGRLTAGLTAGAAILVVATLFASAIAREWLRQSIWWRPTLLPSAARKGERVDISAGEIEAVEFMRFLSDHTGLPLVCDQEEQARRTPIAIVAPITGADGEVVRAILTANRFLVEEEALASGRRFLRVTPPPVPVE